MVSPDVCRACPFVDHHSPGDDPAPVGAIRPDMPVEDLIALLDRPPRAWPLGWEDWEVTHRAHQVAAARFLEGLPEYPSASYRGRGVVIAGGGAGYFPSLYVTIRAIRHVGCSLPIQVWYLGREGELPTDRRAILERLGVECVDADAVRERHPCRILNGWELKVYAVLHAPFEEVLSLDADCYPVRDPSFLFDEPGYRSTGTVFWPDLLEGPPVNWRPFGMAPPGRPMIETGQFVMNKRACWEPLQLAWWLSDHSDWSYMHGYGDKGVLEVAWHWCRAPYTMYQEEVAWSVHSFLHVGPDGKLLLVHRCKDKFRFGSPVYMNPQPFATNRFHPDLPLEAECFGWLRELDRELNPRPANGGSTAAPRLKAYVYTCPERREVCEGTLARFRATDWGEDPVACVDDGGGPTNTYRLAANARRALAAALADDADFFLFLEDDLLFNLHLRHNLAHWPPLRDGWLWMGSLYNPGLYPDPQVAAGDLRASRALTVARGSYYSTQAVVLSRLAVETVLREWDDAPEAFDLKIAAIAERHSPGVLLHLPSLVQHVPVPSTWGGGGNRAQNFDPFFRA